MSWKRALPNRAAPLEPHTDAFKLVPSLETIQRMLKECIHTKDLHLGRRVLSLVRKDHLEAMPMLTDQLIRIFALCGSLRDANYTFGQTINPSLYTWHAIISAHASLGHNCIALELFYCMYYQGNNPNKFLFTCILKVCAHGGESATGQLLHHAIVCVSLGSDVCIGCALVDMYLRCGCVHDAEYVFERQTNGDVVIWSAMIGGCIELGHSQMAVNLFHRSQSERLKPDRVIFLCLLKACVQIQSISLCFLVHAMIIECSLYQEPFIANSLVDMYSRLGIFKEALTVFSKQQHKDTISWGALISGYAQHGCGDAAFHLFDEMLSKGMKLNAVLLVCVLKACTRVTQVHCAHNLTIKSNIVIDSALGNTLVDMYAKCGCIEDAQLVFDRLKHRDETAWGALIAGYAQNGLNLPALLLLVKMEASGAKLDQFSFSCGFKACGGIGTILEGRLLHNCAVKNGLDSHIVVGNALIDMYVKCGSLEEARRSFDRHLNRDSVSWAAMIGGYADYGLSVNAVELFSHMLQKGMEPNKVSFLSILKASCKLESLFLGKMIHHQLIQSGFDGDIPIGNTLVDMYCKCGGLEEALKVFDLLSGHTVVSWSAIIAGHAQHQHDFTVLQLFERMDKEGIEPNRSIFLSCLKACGSIGAITQGSMIHDWVLRSGYVEDVEIGNTLLDMYAKCGRVEEAHLVLQHLQTRSDVSWAAIIAAHASRGDTGLVQQCLEGMLQEGLKPDATIFMSVLMACGHAGEIDKGKQFFKAMFEDYCIAPSNEHFTCMIDLLGRAGHLLEAKQFLQMMPNSLDVAGWIAMLTACDIYSNVKLARGCFDKLVKLDPESTAGYALKLKIFVDANMWDDANELEKDMPMKLRSHIDHLRQTSGSIKRNVYLSGGLDPKVMTILNNGSVTQESDDLGRLKIQPASSEQVEGSTGNHFQSNDLSLIFVSGTLSNKQVGICYFEICQVICALCIVNLCVRVCMRLCLCWQEHPQLLSKIICMQQISYLCTFKYSYA
ncbi:hypothetical protein GOP47_0019303 [Adiantum capillus-veneris]|uniref:Pentatricopeptide repeat-containing protein n=1 Tax=Adiantum capillus-veneris TaxID=13818 RepID=A0A9D4UEW3_ADICA|nr:hypothetical protein GOP47_0019303 [Adiantum capillus-veneris]